jgi:hypothetical protein
LKKKKKYDASKHRKKEQQVKEKIVIIPARGFNHFAKKDKMMLIGR